MLPSQSSFQAVEEVLESLRPVIEANEELYKKECDFRAHYRAGSSVMFRVPWVDDNGQVQGKQRFPCTVQQCHWTIQGRIKTSSFCKLKHHQILRI